MKASVSSREIKGRVSAPSSKSYTIRGLIGGALAHGTSRILQPLGSDDTTAAASVLKKLGTGIRQSKAAWTVNSEGFKAPSGDLFCGDSATTLRFMTAICSVVPGTCRLTAGASLSQRPVQPLIDALRQLGVKCSSNGPFPPVTVEGNKLKGGITSLPGDISSQFVSALLLVAPLTEQGVTVRLTSPLESRPYVMMTLDIMQWFGITVAFNDALDEFQIEPQPYQPTRFKIEGDWSSASYLLALGALAGEVEVTNLPADTMQGDRMILHFLQEMGARITVGRNSVTVQKSPLRAIKADLTDCIDLLPTVAVLAATADGTTELTGIERARIKESDRVAAVRHGLNQMDIYANEETDCLTITGGRPRGALIDTRNDHRIAMAFSVLGTATGNTTIDRAECVTKTYPEFWEVLKSLGGKVEIDGQ